MASEEDTGQFEICDSIGLVLDTIKVQVIFAGINKENLNMTGKVLKKGNLKIPITRLGSWVFHTTKNRSDIERLISTGGPIAAFLFALYKCYPQLTAWVDNPENGSFVLNVEKKEKANILAENAEKMKQNVQATLSEIENVDLKIKIIKIVRDKPISAKPEEPISNIDEKTQVQASSSTETIPKDQVTANDWEYFKLKAELKSEFKTKESKLKTLLKFALCCCKMEKYDEVRSTVSEIRKLSDGVKLREQELTSALENLKTLHQLLFNSSKFTESVEAVFASAELLKKLRKPEKRIELINIFSSNVCESLAKAFALKPDCFDCHISEEDEIGRSTARTRGSGTKWDQANKAQQSGKRASKKFDFKEALRFYDLAIALQPLEMTYHLDKAEVFLSKNELEKSKEECNKALGLKGSDKNKARAFALLGETELRMCETRQAIVNFGKSEKLHFNQDIKAKILMLDRDFKEASRQIIITQAAQVFANLNVPLGFPLIPPT